MDAKYLAGFFDGEGHIGTSLQSLKHYRSYALHASITNTNREILEQIRTEYGGNISAKSHLADAWLHQYHIMWYSTAAKEFIAKIAPHLIVKKEQAELALQFPINEHREKGNLERFAKQKEIAERLSALKKIKREVPPEYVRIAQKEHAEMLRKKVLALKLRSENPHWSLREIAEKVGVSREMVYKYIGKSGV